MVCHSLLQWTTLCQTSPPWPVHLGWPHTAWLGFTELDKAVVLWSDWLVFCDYGFSLSALWCPLATPTVLLGFLLPWTWGVSSPLLQQSAATAPYLGWGYLLTATPPDPECGVAPLGPPAPAQPPLGGGVAPWGHSSWPNFILLCAREWGGLRREGDGGTVRWWSCQNTHNIYLLTSWSYMGEVCEVPQNNVDVSIVTSKITAVKSPRQI